VDQKVAAEPVLKFAATCFMLRGEPQTSLKIFAALPPRDCCTWQTVRIRVLTRTVHFSFYMRVVIDHACPSSGLHAVPETVSRYYARSLLDSGRSFSQQSQYVPNQVERASY